MNKQIEDIAQGQKIIIYAIIANFISNIFLRTELGEGMFIIPLIIACASIYGVYKICTGFEYHIVLTILNILLLFVPLVNIIMLIVLSMRATKRLRSEGYEVGLLGVK